MRREYELKKIWRCNIQYFFRIYYRNSKHRFKEIYKTLKDNNQKGNHMHRHIAKKLQNIWEEQVLTSRKLERNIDSLQRKNIELPN